MTENIKPCDVHAERMKTLFKRGDDIEKRIEKLEEDKSALHNLDKNMAVQTELLKGISESNKKQDMRMDKQDKRMDEQQQINIKINENLTELTQGQKTLNNKVNKLEEKVDANEEIHKIDLREVEKSKWKDILFKFVLPAGAGGFAIYEVVKFLDK